MRWPFICTAFVVIACNAHGADIGGWMEQKSKSELLIDECPEIVALASQSALLPMQGQRREPAAQLYYASGMCYLLSDKVTRDPVAASAWLARAAELDHPLARRALLSLRDTTSPMHPSGHHCHDLGLGRKLCHGGLVPP